MAIKYVRSTDGSNSDDGSTWTLAKATIAGAATAAAAGDTIYVSQSHAETQGTNLTIDVAGTPDNPVIIAGCNDSAEPPTAESTTATVSTTAQANIYLYDSLIASDISFNCGNGANYSRFDINGSGTHSVQVYNRCAFRLNDTHPSSNIGIGSYDATKSSDTILNNCVFKLTNVGHVIYIGSKVTINGGSIESGGTSPTAAFYLGGNGPSGRALIESLDMSVWSSSFKLFADAGRPGLAVVTGCKMPASWSADNLVANVSGVPNARYELYNCTPFGGSLIPFRIKDYLGTIYHESTVVMTGGSSVGSAKMVSNASAKEANNGLQLFNLQKEITTSGSSVTATVEFVHDSVTNLTNADICVDLQYPVTNGTASTSSQRSSHLATATDCPSSSQTWTTTGLTNPNKQKISIAFTPTAVGIVKAVVRLTKASKTVFVDAKLTVA